MTKISDKRTLPKKQASPFAIVFKVNDKTETYRVDEELFLRIKKEIAPYRACVTPQKPVRCVETGQVFKNAYKAMDWLLKTN